MANVFLNGYNPFYDETRPTLSDELKHAMAGNTDFSSPDVVASCTRIHNYYLLKFPPEILTCISFAQHNLWRNLYPDRVSRQRATWRRIGESNCGDVQGI
ncbi:hypothetical protein [Noviherbaspirillum suwonense]|uniref:hypothetical protein n=1 Tax=Noviherbaspirillum suwonense TaxID=1224511 RepID=UPI0024B65035|nr:hypothetical protein [Noviherbaspirillum suwonense]